MGTPSYPVERHADADKTIEMKLELGADGMWKTRAARFSLGAPDNRRSKIAEDVEAWRNRRRSICDFIKKTIGGPP
jgi:hypothetical protein